MLSIFFCLFASICMQIPSPNSEVEAAVSFMQTLVTEKYVDPTELAYIRFFTTYAIPDEAEEGELSLRDKAEKVLPFVINSLQRPDAEGVVVKVRPVPNSDTLWWIDIREPNWGIDSFEKVSLLDPYFREPWVDWDSYETLRQYAGNAILRADWFIVEATDVTKQVDRELSPIIYYELLYGNTPPKNVEELRELWGVDYDKIEKLKILRGVIVDTGKSGVSRHNRQMIRARTEMGYYWQTYDVKNQDLERDYIENLPLLNNHQFKDAGEVILTNKIGLQVYMLLDGQDKVVEFADPTLVIDRSDSADVRVRTAKSCIICHATGLNRASNALIERKELGINLNVLGKEKAMSVERFYFNDINRLIETDNELYAEAVRLVCNETPENICKYYQEVYNWHLQPVSLQQAALECGLTVEEYEKACVNTASGRVASVLRSIPMPRESWDKLIGGGFAVSMLLYKQLPIPTYEQYNEAEKKEESQENISEGVTNVGTQQIRVVREANLQSDTQIIGKIPIGTILTYTKIVDNEWYNVEWQGKTGFVNKSFVEVVQ